MNPPRILIACIGNIFLGDDAFGVEVARSLARLDLPDEVRVVDFGIRGFDLIYALLDPYEAVILVDATPRGGPPGTLYVLEPIVTEAPGAEGANLMDAYGMDPVKVLRLASAMGGTIDRLVLVGCEPAKADDADDVPSGLSDAVRAAAGEAVPLIQSLVARLLRGEVIKASG